MLGSPPCILELLGERLRSMSDRREVADLKPLPAGFSWLELVVAGIAAEGETAIRRESAP